VQDKRKGQLRAFAIVTSLAIALFFLVLALESEGFPSASWVVCGGPILVCVILARLGRQSRRWRLAVTLLGLGLVVAAACLLGPPPLHEPRTRFRRVEGSEVDKVVETLSLGDQWTLWYRLPTYGCKARLLNPRAAEFYDEKTNATRATLVADDDGLALYDAKGTVIWQAPR